jgi:proteasome lid subunit RPN8/RPN11
MSYLSDDVKQNIIKHCLTESPNQACGLVLFDEHKNGVEVAETVNYGAWPYGFQISAQALFEIAMKAKQKGYSIGGVYHCHLASSAIPTGRDLYRPIPNGMLYIIVSLVETKAPELRAYLKEDNEYHEVDC